MHDYGPRCCIPLELIPVSGTLKDPNKSASVISKTSPNYEICVAKRNRISSPKIVLFEVCLISLIQHFLSDLCLSFSQAPRKLL